jgi:hypothetical protein
MILVSQVTSMTIHRTRFVVLTAVLISFSGGALCASTLQFGVVGCPIDLSADVR